MKRGATIGSVIWLGLSAANRWCAVDLSWIELLFMFAPLVIVPLGLELSARLDRAFAEAAPDRVARAIQLPAALLVVASFFFPRGALAAALGAHGTANAFGFTLCGLLGFVLASERAGERSV